MAVRVRRHSFCGGGYMHQFSIGALALGLAAVAYAQTPAPDPSRELQRQDRQRQELRERMEVQPWFPSAVPAKTPDHQRLPDEQPCAQIDRVLVRGILSSARLQLAVSGIQADDPPYGRCLGSQGVTLLIQRVQQALAEQGYITSHVHVLEQDLNTATLVLQIDEGRVAQIVAESTEVALPRLVWAVREGQILNLQDIEQSSDNLQRLPSLRTSIQIQPGQEPGTSNLMVTA